MLPAFLGVASLGLQFRGARRAKRANKQAEREALLAASDEAEQLEGKAKDEMAAGSYRIEDIKREGTNVKSRAKALGGASGAGGYEDTLADIDAETEYRALFALHNSKQSARDLKLAAIAVRRHGVDAARAHRERGRADQIDATAGMLSGAQSLFERYGRGYNSGVST